MAIEQAIGGDARTRILREIDQAVAVDDIDRAIALAQTAEGQGIETPLILNLIAFALECDERFDEALARLDRALRMQPDDVLTLCAIGQCLSKQRRAAHAVEAFKAAISLNPNHAPAYAGLAAEYVHLGDGERAEESARRAAQLDPLFPAPLGVLAGLALTRGDLDQAGDYARRALALDPGEASAVRVLADIEGRQNGPQAAVDRLETVLANTQVAPVHEEAMARLLADQLDRLGRYDDAFAMYGRANAAQWRLLGAPMQSDKAEMGPAMCRRIEDFVAARPASAWSPVPMQPSEQPPAKHVFLVGFVRSGTTLLEQVLASHPDIVALEEKATLRSLAPEFFADDAAMERLTRLTEAEAADLRKRYWASVRAHGIELEGKVFVDKAPLAGIWLPLASRLFPEARVLFAIRDPRDVVLSCYRHSFVVDFMAGSFANLDMTAGFYDGVMRLADLYLEKLPIPTHRHRLEDLIEDFDGQVKGVCEFLGIDWNPAMRDFVETARRRDVRTPSVEQVRQPLNRRGVAHWKHYQTGLAPILPVLAPWVDRFGYEP